MKALFAVGLAVLILGILSFFIAIPHSENHGIKAGDVNIGVQTHDQRVPFTARGLQIPNMPGMQQIEDAIGEYDALTLVAQVLHKRHRFGRRQNLLRHRKIFQVLYLMVGEKVQRWRGR